jgi:hypothetical protein
MTGGLTVANEADAQRNMGARATAPAIPRTEPTNAIAAVSFITRRNARGLLAPRAIRMLISFRHLNTACAVTPENPTLARIKAEPLTEAHPGKLMRHVGAAHGLHASGPKEDQGEQGGQEPARDGRHPVWFCVV